MHNIETFKSILVFLSSVASFIINSILIPCCSLKKKKNCKNTRENWPKKKNGTQLSREKKTQQRKHHDQHTKACNDTMDRHIVRSGFTGNQINHQGTPCHTRNLWVQVRHTSDWWCGQQFLWWTSLAPRGTHGLQEVSHLSILKAGTELEQPK